MNSNSDLKINTPEEPPANNDVAETSRNEELHISKTSKAFIGVSGEVDRSKAARGTPTPTHGKGMCMSHRREQQQTLRINTDKKDFVDIQLQGSQPVTVRLQLDQGCNCQHDTASRPGSYVDSDLGPR